jgi:signal transduction histidine kinase/CheY-like chemotaxis protein
MTKGASTLLAQSREVELVCDPDGTVRWADERARRVLAAAPGLRLQELAPPGTDEKVRMLVAHGRERAIADWEVTLVAFGRPATFVFAAEPEGEKVRMLGLRLPDGYGAAMTQVNDSLAEVLDLNREIARQKRQLEQQKGELEAAYQELDESNRGVRTLHAELEDKAATLQRTSEVKSRVVANISHEFRTPLHTILGLARLLLDATDGPLTPEQEKQIRFIRTAAEELSEIVNDMLDLSKAESGKVQVRPERFGVVDFFAALRGMLRPLLAPAAGVELVFDAAGAIELETDQGKVAQILRNLVSNALKFTERGEVRVSFEADGDRAIFRVKDTGIGIAPENFDRVFEEFGQVDSHLQRQVKGTGLGLPLSRRLAALLGGTLTVDSRVGEGSTFTLAIPRVHPEVQELATLEQRPLDPAKAPILVVEDDRKTIFIYERFLALAGFQVVPARTVDDARRLVRTFRPAAVVLDIMLEQETTWDFLGELKKDPETCEVPVLVVTVSSTAQKARALGADEFWLKPVDQDRLIRKLRSISIPGKQTRILVIDDDPGACYLLRRLLGDTPYVVSEATTGAEGVRLAQEERPAAILLDFFLREGTAFDVIDDLKADPRTRAIPVIVVTSHQLAPEERARLAAETEAILSKGTLSRELALGRIRDALRKAGVGSADPLDATGRNT